jgi:hypothetical protein
MVCRGWGEFFGLEGVRRVEDGVLTCWLAVARAHRQTYLHLHLSSSMEKSFKYGTVRARPS